MRFARSRGRDVAPLLERGLAGADGGVHVGGRGGGDGREVLAGGRVRRLPAGGVAGDLVGADADGPRVVGDARGDLPRARRVGLDGVGRCHQRRPAWISKG